MESKHNVILFYCDILGTITKSSESSTTSCQDIFTLDERQLARFTERLYLLLEAHGCDRLVFIPVLDLHPVDICNVLRAMRRMINGQFDMAKMKIYFDNAITFTPQNLNALQANLDNNSIKYNVTQVYYADDDSRKHRSIAAVIKTPIHHLQPNCLIPPIEIPREKYRFCGLPGIEGTNNCLSQHLYELRGASSVR